MSATADAIITAGLRPELFTDNDARSISRSLIVATLVVLVVGGFAFRARSLSSEGFADDELNKLDAANEYRTRGLTAANGEHPFLMKAAITITLIASEKWNHLVDGRVSGLHIPTEAAVRLPNVIVGSFVTLLLYLVVSELFGGEIALLAAALWAFDPVAIGFNRIAKEDTFVVFFFLLANVFWLRGQRVAESEPHRNPRPYYWATAVAFGAMVASKYLPQYLAISVSYYWMFQAIPETRWRLGRPRFLLFLIIIGVSFLVFNPPIFLPETWRQMANFAGSRLLFRDSYEFMGQRYLHGVNSWFRGVAWYFYFVFLGVKLAPLTVIAFLTGLPLLFRRRLGDGRYLLLFWMFFWLQFTISGSKFTRYTTFVLPAVYTTAAIGAYYSIRWLAQRAAEITGSDKVRLLLKAGLASLLVIFSALAAASAVPHYRLYTNVFGGGLSAGGRYFPQDDFYDGQIKGAMNEVARIASPGARVATETVGVCRFYAAKANRGDLSCVYLSDPAAVKTLSAGDLVVVAKGRHYLSNDRVFTLLQNISNPVASVSLGEIPAAAEVYLLDQKTVDALK